MSVSSISPSSVDASDDGGASRLVVDLGERSYPIIIGENLLSDCGRAVRAVSSARRAAVITDDNVAAHYLIPVMQSLGDADFEAKSLIIPAGEHSKDFATLERVCDDLLQWGIDRKCVVVALGGGVVGDLAGFASAVLLRGVDFVQAPTTLLAQVDSSVGGKTGINARTGKNLIGAFHQPRLVLADTGALNTLPGRELAAGYAEVVKYGLIDRPEFFAWLEGNGQDVMSGDLAARQHAIRTSCAAKADIVARDEREGGVRALLNLGHTFGHALEAECGFSDRLLHGEGVAIGCVMAFEFSRYLGLCSGGDVERISRHFSQIGMPTSLADVSPTVGAWSAERLIDHMGRDKKTEAGKLTFILARGIGRCFIQKDVDVGVLREFLTESITAAGR